MAGFRRILVASDFSKASQKAFTTALALAKANRASAAMGSAAAPQTDGQVEERGNSSRNFARAVGLVVDTRGSVRNTDWASPIGSLGKVHTIFT